MNVEIKPYASSEVSGLAPDDALRDAEARVRREPAVAAHRWALFQWLCIVCEWERAVQQLQVYAQLDSASSSDSMTPRVHAYRDLVRAERARALVMAGQHEPRFVFDDVPVWMRGLHGALGLAAQGELDAADAAREIALDRAPLISGRSEREVSTDPADQAAAIEFSWIGDSDSRLGPVCEFVAAGCYRWLAFEDIARWTIARPTTLVDLVWAPCSLTLHDGTLLRGFMPARYPQVPARESSADERSALLMVRSTVWRENGRTGVIASGAKTWATSAGDFGMFELRDCTFGRAREGGEADVPAVSGRSAHADLERTTR
jgi:type VI secretion system protein ImpE